MGASIRTEEEVAPCSDDPIERLTRELFCLHDLDGDGAVEEEELIWLNEQIARLHGGEDTDVDDVRNVYRDLFRAHLDPEGRPASEKVFCKYTRKVLDALDRDPLAQEMILEQWAAEAQVCR